MSGDQPSSPAPGSAHPHLPGAWEPPTREAMQKVLPQYRLVAVLGRGGMGAIYKGKQEALDRFVAIKILPTGMVESDPTFSERFKNEARAMAKLNHPGIVSVYDFGETADGRLYFVMEYVEGIDVAQMLKSQGSLPPDQVAAIMAHVSDALHYAHAHGVIHRDIKPANVLISREGQVKVADFGLAKFADPSRQALVTVTGLAMGTPDYAAPESLLTGLQVDCRADLYSAGVMLYHMLTGEVPRGLFPMPSVRAGAGIDQRFDDIVATAMQTNRESRYQTAAEMRAALDAVSTTRRADTGSAVPALARAMARISERGQAVTDSPAVGRLNKRSKTLRLTGFWIVVAALLIWMAMGWNQGDDRVQHSPFAALPAARWLPVITDPAKALDSPNSALRDGWYRNPAALVRGPIRDAALRTRVRYAKGGNVKLTLRAELVTGKRLSGYVAEINPSSPDIISLKQVVVGPDNHLVERESRVLGQWRMQNHCRRAMNLI